MYYWPSDFNDKMGLAREAKAKYDKASGTYRVPRFTQDIRLTPAPHLVNDGKANTVANEPGVINVQRANALAYLKPVFR
jgi:hypothetical protein